MQLFQNKKNFLLGVGFEPTHLAILELESSALDHSAIQATTPADRRRGSATHLNKGHVIKKNQK